MLKVENYFEYKTAEEVFEDFNAEILEFMKKKIGKAFEIESSAQMELGGYSDKAYSTELDDVGYYASRVDVKVKALNSRKSKSVILLFTPFSVKYFGVRKEFSELGKMDKDLTLALREHMVKEFGKAEYEKASSKFANRVKQYKQKNKNDGLSL